MKQKSFSPGCVPVIVITIAVFVISACAKQDVKRPSFKEWYYPSGIIMPRGTTPDSVVHGVTGHSTEWLVIANLTDQPAKATITYYFLNDPPIQRVRDLAPATTTTYETGKVKGEEFPLKKLYGVKVESEVNILVQPTQGETETVKPGKNPSNTNMSYVAYPGPLGKKETRWIYGDGHAIPNKTGKGWEDREWIYILNPDPSREANIKITFYFKERQFVHTLKVPSERIREVDLIKLLNTAKGFYPVIESDIPVVVNQVRRPVIMQNTAPRGGWATLAFPIGDLDLPLPADRRGSGIQ